MNSLAKTNYRIYKLSGMLLHMMLIPVILNAQNTEITEINQGNTRIESTVINITQANKKAQNILVRTGDRLPEGATIKTSNTKLKLNAEGNEQEILPNSTHSIVRITSKEHAHKTTKGKSVHYVNNKSVVYKASGKRIYAKAPGTIFSVAVDGEAESFNTLQGQITTVEEVKLLVKQDSKNVVSKRDRPLTTGKTTYINAGESKDFDGSTKVEKYDSYDEALSAIHQQLDKNRKSDYIDIEQIANEYILVGELLLDVGNPNNAITYFETAIGYFHDLEFRELSIAEGYLLLAEVYSILEDNIKVNKYANDAIDLLEPIMQMDSMEYQFAKEDGDYELMNDIAYDLFDEYDFLGWAYEVLGYDFKADSYYNKADNLGIE